MYTNLTDYRLNCNGLIPCLSINKGKPLLPSYVKKLPCNTCYNALFLYLKPGYHALPSYIDAPDPAFV